MFPGVTQSCVHMETLLKLHVASSMKTDSIDRLHVLP